MRMHRHPWGNAWRAMQAVSGGTSLGGWGLKGHDDHLWVQTPPGPRGSSLCFHALASPLPNSPTVSPTGRHLALDRQSVASHRLCVDCFRGSCETLYLSAARGNRTSTRRTKRWRRTEVCSLWTASNCTPANAPSTPRARAALRPTPQGWSWRPTRRRSIWQTQSTIYTFVQRWSPVWFSDSSERYRHYFLFPSRHIRPRSLPVP